MRLKSRLRRHAVRLRGLHRRTTTACVAAILIAALPGCATPPPGPQPGGTAVVAHVYSGRPDPEWWLAPDGLRQLVEMVRALPPGGPPLEPGLGYRGMVVREADAVLPGCSYLRAYRGVVSAECGGTVRSLADPGRAVERFLADSGLARVAPPVYALIRQELGGGS